MSNTSIGHEPDDDWTFDESVAEVFDDMLARSIPQYRLMRRLTNDIVRRFAGQYDTIVDVGASKGGAVEPNMHLIDTLDVEFHLIERSKPMREQMRKRFGLEIDAGSVHVHDEDLRHDFPDVGDIDICLSVLTMQFIPINYRHSILQRIYDRLTSGGIFILVEKVLGETNRTDGLLVDRYHNLKHENGYSYEEIDRKAASLEGRLVPLTASWNVDAIERAGFDDVECYWRFLNFAGWIAIKQ